MLYLLNTLVFLLFNDWAIFFSILHCFNRELLVNVLNQLCFFV